MKTLVHRFVEYIPDQIEERVLYITMQYRTAVHNCVCGCGNKVVTPITPTDWSFWFDGETVSLYPSIGNWSFKCKSHYFIRKNKIYHARKWEDWEIEANREKDIENKKEFFKSRENEN